MDASTPFLTFSYTILWLKLLLTAAALLLLYLRYRAGTAGAYSPRTKLAVGLAVACSFAVFHNLGTPRAGSFVHFGEMFHYYVGPKYFQELGYFELYNAVIVADSELGNDFAPMPFYNDLRTYKNVKRDVALKSAERIKGLFSAERWDAFKHDIAFFKSKINKPGSPNMIFVLMDHGYNGSPVSTFLLGTITNLVPVEQLGGLVLIDVALVLAMIALVFRSFGFECGALFSVYFFTSLLSGQEFLSGSLLRYDWLLYIVVAVCLLDRGRYAGAAFFLTLSAMLRLFPALLFCGVGVSLFQKLRAARRVDKQSARFTLTAALSALALFLLPATTLGSATQPWREFYEKISLHGGGVYVNHLGFAGVALFEPSQLSLESFATAFRSPNPDIVRHWQEVKQHELHNKRPLMVFAALAVLASVSVLIWRRREDESHSVLWPLFLVYATSYVSSYYYTFLCLFVLLFFRRPDARSSFVPVSLLLALNMAALITDACKPSPIVFYTLLNVYLFLCLASILGYELYKSYVTPQREPATAEPAKRRARTRRK